MPKPMAKFTSASFKTLLHASILEFVGTAFFLLLGFGGIQAATGLKSSTDVPASSLEQKLYISVCMGLSLLVSAWMFYRVTGALFNPNISLALLIVGVIDPVKFVMYCVAQLLGAIAASAIILGLSNAPLAVNTVLTDTTLAKGIFIEMFITAALVIAVLMLATEKHEATPFAPIGVGLTLFACHLWAVFYTGAAMNTARAFGPAVVTGFPNSDHWVYWLGPFLGSLVGSAFYILLKHYQYWTLNPGQDTVDPKQSPQDPVETIRETLVAVRSNNDSGEKGTANGVPSRSTDMGKSTNEGGLWRNEKTGNGVNEARNEQLKGVGSMV